MHEEEQNLNDLDRRLQAYYRAEDQELDYPSGLWEQLAPRLGEQRRRGWLQRVPAISWIIPTWPPISILRNLGASRARLAMAASLALLLLIGIAYLGVTLALPSTEPIASTAPPSTTYALAPTASPYSGSDGETDLVALGEETFTGTGGCSACHAIEGITAGLVGPDLTHIGTDASGRKSGVSAEDYLIESIRSPEAFVAEGVERAMPRLMTSAITANLTDQQVKALVQFLLAQK